MTQNTVGPDDSGMLTFDDPDVTGYREWLRSAQSEDASRIFGGGDTQWFDWVETPRHLDGASDIHRPMDPSAECAHDWACGRSFGQPDPLCAECAADIGGEG